MITIVCLVILAFFLIFLEVFTPSGLLGFLAFCCISGAGYLAYHQYGTGVAMGIILGSGVLGILSLALALKVAKKYGRSMSLQTQVQGRSVERSSDALVGLRGVALTSLAPGGKVRVEGKDYEASSLSGLLRHGAEIEVVRVEDFRIIVKKT